MKSLEYITMEDEKTENKKEVLVTAALPYINNVPHLGHIAGSHLPADIFARYCRLKGHDTLFVGGTDENGSPSELAAEEIGVPLDIFSTKLHNIHKGVYEWFGISYDNFSRTSKDIHKKTSQDFFKNLYDKGFITKGKMNVFYSPTDDRFLADRFVQGNCPKCNFEGASGDQCEKCTSVYDSTELVNPKSTITKNPVEAREAEHLFLRLDKLENNLRKWIDKQGNWRSQVKSIANGWIKQGLKPRSVTRDLKNGVPVLIKGFEDKVMYVWFDAPIGYISATKEALPKKWEKYWKNDDAKIVQFLGKDNIPFHTLFFPAMLLAHENLNLPTNVSGYQYLNYEGEKFSKSKKQGVFCEKLAQTNINPDLLRYYITTILPETSDSEFKWNDFQSKTNSELLGNLGNFVNRTLKFVDNKLEQRVVRPDETKLNTADKKLEKQIARRVKKIENYLEKVEIRKAFSEVFALSTDGNKYFEDNKPWVGVKGNDEEKKRAQDALYQCVDLCRTLAIVASPFVPNASKNIWKQLNLKGNVDSPGNWDNASSGSIPKKHKIGKPETLFRKLENDYLEKFKKIVTDAPDLNQIFKEI